MKIQLVTINTWKSDGEYHQRMQVLADQLKQLTPHIVACQECFLSQDEAVDTLRFLAEELDMYYYFTPARLKPRLLGDKIIMSYSGMGVLSAFKLELFDEFDLPTDDADGERKVQQVIVEISKEKKLLLTNIHLTNLNNAKDLRQSQLEMIGERTEVTGFAHNIICGDFNAETTSDEVQAFITLKNAADCYALGSGAEPRVSMPGTGECIDHIFSLPVADAESYTAFTKAAIVLDEADPQSGIFPSDHFGISTTLITV